MRITPALILHISTASVWGGSPIEARRTSTKPRCVGDKLGSREKLFPNEFICAGKNDAYRFGLDSRGQLVQYDGNKIDWTPGKKGSYLAMQGDGNLVLKDEKDDSIWASGCYAAGAHLGFSSDYPGIGARTMVPTPKYIEDEDYWTVWATEAHPSGVSDETSCTPPIYCKKDAILRPGQTLHRDEYLCPATDNNGWWDHSYTFGLNNVGQLVLRQGRYKEDIIWSSGWETRDGVSLKMKKNGNLVLSDKNGRSLWKSGCKSSGNTLEMTSGAIIMTDENEGVSWYMDYDGKESKCFPGDVPPDRCALVSPEGNVCRMRMIDSFNKNDVILEVKDLGNSKYKVTDDVKGKEWKEKVKKASTGALLTDAGVPEVTCHELMENYKMRDDEQLTFKTQKKECTEFGKNLIYFMIEEWFYFG